MPPHLLRCRRLAVAYYSFTLGRLEAGAPSTFAHSELHIDFFALLGSIGICRLASHIFKIPALRFGLYQTISVWERYGSP
jgi:hypothetical protein